MMSQTPYRPAHLNGILQIPGITLLMREMAFKAKSRSRRVKAENINSTIEDGAAFRLCIMIKVATLSDVQASLIISCLRFRTAALVNVSFLAWEQLCFRLIPGFSIPSTEYCLNNENFVKYYSFLPSARSTPFKPYKFAVSRYLLISRFQVYIVHNPVHQHSFNYLNMVLCNKIEEKKFVPASFNACLQTQIFGSFTTTIGNKDDSV